MAEQVIGIGTHAHSVLDYDVHFNHCYVFTQWAKQYGDNLIMLGLKGLHAAQARELMVDTAIEQGCNHLLVVDADHIVTEHMLPHLLQSKDAAMVSGVICRRYHPFGQVGYIRDGSTGMYGELNLPLDGKIYEVNACAFGCTLINLEHMKTLKKPWFRDTCEVDANGELSNFRSDINLCNAFIKAGFKVLIDTRVLVGHVGNPIFVYPQNADFLRDLKSMYDREFTLQQGQQGYFRIPSRTI